MPATMTKPRLKIPAALRLLIEAGIAEPYWSGWYSEPLNVEAGGQIYMGNMYRHDYSAESEYPPEIYRLNGPWGGSDYSGDDVTESNHRSLLRDYGHLLVDEYGGHDSYGLSVTPDFGRSDWREAKAFAEILIGLKHEYPIYDEDDHSALIQERAEAAIGSDWLRSDLESELSKMLGTGVDLDAVMDGDVIWDLMYEHDIHAEAEGHRDVIFPGMGDEPFRLDLARAAIASGGLDPDDLYELTPLGYELLGDWRLEEFKPVPGQLAFDTASDDTGAERLADFLRLINNR
ncbi:hypothetical protein ACFVH6_25540 [Spirillospora sp. NPDC127200]